MALVTSQLSWGCQEGNPSLHKANLEQFLPSYNSSSFDVNLISINFLVIEKFVIEKCWKQY